MDKATALRRIQKCLALANSPEPHEAARALSQAQALMTQFGIEHPELLAAGVEREWAKSRATTRPPDYEAYLANVVAQAFGCDLVFSQKYVGMSLRGGYNFIGVGPAAEVGCYTFTVLARKLTSARAAYTATALKRYRKNKVAAADAFCEGWVAAVRAQITKAVRSIEHETALAAYKDLHYQNTGTLKTSSRELSERANPDVHRYVGILEGRKAKVNEGIGAGRQEQMLLR